MKYSALIGVVFVLGIVVSGSGCQNPFGKFENPNDSKSPTYVKVTDVFFNPSNLYLIAGGTSGSVNASWSPSNASNQQLTWSSSNQNIASVTGSRTGNTQQGVVQPISAGTASISAASTDGPYAVCVVTVSAAPTTTTTVASSSGYNNVPAAANGTWSLGGLVIFTISNALMSYNGLSGLTAQTDSSGNLYMLSLGTRTPLSGYTWNGSVIKYNGIALIKS